MPTFSNRWFAGIVGTWTNLFSRSGWFDGRPLTIVEIGSFEGQSTLWMLENLAKHPDSRIYCIDSFAGGVEHSDEQTGGLRHRFEANIAESEHASKVVVRQGLSRDGLLSLLHDGVRADFVYVDGSHQAPDVLEDLVLSFRLLKVNGLMICDDYLWFMENMSGTTPGREDLLNSPKIAVDSFVNIFIRKIRIIRHQPLLQFTFQKIAE